MASIIIATLILIAVYAGTKRLSGLQLAGVLLFTGAGIILVIFPDLSSFVAQRLHVGRGTDLLFYVTVLAGLFVVSNFYFRFKKNEEALIALARRVAIDTAQPPSANKNLGQEDAVPLGSERNRPIKEID